LFSNFRKNTAKRDPFLFAYYFFLAKKSVWRKAERFSFSLLFLLSKEIGMARSGTLFFLPTFSF
jgi:hypothetical protein